MHSLGPLEEATAYQIYRLARLMRQNLKKALKAGGLDVTAEQYFLLYRLLQKDGVAQSELADRVLKDYPNLTRHIDSLEKKGLVVRQSDPADRRKYLINLTDIGRQQMDLAVPIIQEERERLFGDYDEKSLHQFHSFLRELQAKVT